MAGKIIIDCERCKGCGLCLVVCPNAVIGLSEKSNSKGLFPACVCNDECIACGACALVCPEAAIEIFRDTKVMEIRPAGRKAACLVREKQ